MNTSEMNREQGLSLSQIEQFHRQYEANDQVKVLNAAMAKTPMADLAFVPMNAARLNGDFSIEIPTHGITAQEKSGRCWMFAALNILREAVIQKCNLEDFELSQNYLTFYDKLEKANNFLQMVIDHADEPWNGQYMQYLLRGIDDGGYWCEAADLIRKYGVVPKDANPESYQSNHTDKFMTLLNQLLKKDAAELRNLVKNHEDPKVRKEEMLSEVYRALAIAFGEPVRQFNFEYRDKDHNYHCERNLTPQEFYEKYVGISLDEYVPVSCEPYPNRPVHQPVAFHSTCNMAGRNMQALSVTQEELEQMILTQLRHKEPLWFACDALAYGARKEGVWDPDSFQYAALMGCVDFDLSKSDRLVYKVSAPNHAMMLTGVNLDENGIPDRWKIENSWGKDVGKNGYFVCSEKYFREYVYEAVILKKYLTEDQLKMLEKEPVIINPWEED